MYYFYTVLDSPVESGPVRGIRAAFGWRRRASMVSKEMRLLVKTGWPGLCPVGCCQGVWSGLGQFKAVPHVYAVDSLVVQWRELGSVVDGPSPACWPGFRGYRSSL